MVDCFTVAGLSLTISLYPLLSNCKTWPDMTEKLFDLDVKNQNKQMFALDFFTVGLGP